VSYPAARYAFTWAADAGRWQIAVDGAPLLATEAGQLGAATVIIQRVQISTTDDVEDAAGNVSPVAHTVGSGTVTMLRDGQRYEGTWSRAAPEAPTRFTDAAGAPLPLAAGPTWILLVAA